MGQGKRHHHQDYEEASHTFPHNWPMLFYQVENKQVLGTLFNPRWFNLISKLQARAFLK
jgi:hypothetical protein